MEYRHYETFKDLQREHLELAKMLVEAVGEGPWQEEHLMYYPTLEDLAMYEVKEGWIINYA